MEEGKLTLHYIPRLVKEVLDEVVEKWRWQAQERNITLQIDSPEADLVVSLDWLLIQRVMDNLLSNALKHSPSNTTITLSSALLSQNNTPYLSLAVVDQGEGIAVEDQQRIFERFTQATHRKGGSATDTGLGLTFCKLATEVHGGALQVKSTLGRGATFALMLPAVVTGAVAS